jgi:hypothetical protein
MKISTAQQFLVNMIVKGVQVPVMFNGPTGVGKTWMGKDAIDICNEKYRKKGTPEFHFIDLRLATQEPGDLIGMPRNVEVRREVDGEEIITYKMVWTKPEWWPEDGTRGLLYLDELNRAPLDVRQAVFQLVQEWRMHTHELPEGWYIASAINPDNGQFQVETLDIAMLRRFCQIKITPDHRDWIRWGEEYGIRKAFLKCISDNPKLLYKEEKFDIVAYPSPEGYRMCDELIEENVIPHDGKGENNVMEVLAGIIGLDAASVVTQYLIKDVDTCVTAEQLLDEYDEYKDDIHKQTNDRMSKTVEELVTMFEKTKQPRNKTQLENLVKFLKDVKPEWKTSFIVAVIENEELLVKLGKDRDLKRQLRAIRSKAKDEEV